MKRNIISIVMLLVFSLSFSQSKKDILLTVNEKPVYTSEFKRVYNKNLDLVKDESQKDIDSYLDLFVDYKLKVEEAYAQKLDEDKNYTTEYTKYRDQLSRNYIFEDKITNELTLEAYQRGLEEINANHILVLTGYEDTPQDTLKAYNKIKSIYEKAKSGQDFEILAKTYSEEPNAKETAGKLGYFTVFSMVYPFETMAYNTKAGEVSEIVRTQFGYHIIKINDRRQRSEQITVSHIMITDTGNDRTFNPEERINQLSVILKQGESFESLAKQYSDDKNSAINGGRLQKFRRGDLRASEFEDAAYTLKNVGDISEPVKTKFGWHLIRLEEKHMASSYEDEKEFLEQKVKGGLRSKIVTSALNNKIKEKFKYKKVGDYLPFFESYLTDEVFKRAWNYDTIPANNDAVLFTIGKKQLRYNDFAKFINDNQKRAGAFKQKTSLLATFYEEFETAELKNYFKENLELENEEYAATISEYRNGLLIFDVMDKNIWKRAKNDSLGLQTYYEQVKGNYIWKERVNAVIISATSNLMAQQAQELLSQGKTAEEVKEQLNVDDKVNILISQGVFENGQRELPENFEIKEGISKVYSKNDRFILVKVNEVIPSGIKALEAIKGKVMSDYQNYLEVKWMEELRQKYTVDINKRAFKKVKKELKS
jgi:peptidyl-prolyl cis-trans isomerase SurA